MADEVVTDEDDFPELGDESKALAFHILEMLRPQVSQLSEQTFSLAKWLLASLLAVNGGGLLLVANSGKLGVLLLAATLWVGGIASAILAGLFGYQRGVAGAKVLAEMVTHLGASIIKGRMTFDMVAEAKKLQFKRSPALIAGVFSLVLFVGGAIAAGASLFRMD